MLTSHDRLKASLKLARHLWIISLRISYEYQSKNRTPNALLPATCRRGPSLVALTLAGGARHEMRHMRLMHSRMESGSPS